jgi:hypothetical protein
MRALPRVVLLAAGLFACRAGNPSGDPVDQPASPQAKAEPAPIASLPSGVGSASTQSTAQTLDGGIVPQPLRADHPILADTTTKETTKEGIAGYSLSAVLRAGDVAQPTKGVDPGALDLARKKTETRLAIDLAPTHARIVLGAGFVLPEGTELRERIDRYGHVVYSPEEGTYRVAAPGALRALLGERRLDVAPASPAEVTHNGEGPKRFGRPTHKVEVATRAAKGSFEIGHLGDLGDGGTLLCRSLLELMGAPAGTPLCSDGDLPLHAELRWTSPPAPAPGLTAKDRIASTLFYDVLTIARRNDLAAASLAVPPPQAAFVEAPFPLEGSKLLLARPDLVALRQGGAEAPLVLVNSTDELRFAWLEGVAIGWVAPGGRLEVPGLVAGRYAFGWRTFLADAIEPPELLTLPATSDLGGVDAGPQVREPDATPSRSPRP